MSGTNTYTGATSVSGTLLLSNADALSTTTGISLADGAVLRPTLGGAVINGAIMLDAGTVTVTAPTVGSSGGTVYRLYLDGPISGAGDLVLLGIQGSNVYGTVVLGAASSYTGATLLTTDGGTTNNNIFVELGTDNALPTTTVLTLDGLNGTGSGRSTQLNLMGYSQTLAGLTNVPRTSRSQRVVNTSATPAILMIDGSGDDTFSGFLGTSTTNGNYALTKSGTGTLTLSGNRAYTGDTTVNGGILSLGNVNANDDLSTMAIASGAKLELSYAGTDTVAALVINGALQLDGVYGHADSGADNGGQGVGFFDTFFAAGTGTITVIGGFSSWITGTFANGTIPGGQQGPNDDYDSDGVSNLVEYAVDGEDPTVPNAAIGSFTATTLSFTKRAGTSGLTYAILESADLGVSDVWEEVAGGSYVNDPTTISYTLTPGTPVRNFIRLQVLAN